MPDNVSTITESERIARVRLARTETVGPITYRTIMARFHTATAALDELPQLARRGGRRKPLRPPSATAVERELESLERLGGRALTIGEPDYPTALAAVEDAPPVLATIGHAHLFARPCVAVVGARNASTNGRKLARDLAAALGENGYVVVSGLARGIDTAAHGGALSTGTVGVLAGGIDVVYPPENKDLYAHIAGAGALVSEAPVGTEPMGRHFPRRNRIISGLSLGVVVVEAARRSGSLITARLAAEQGRDVFAVPGSPLDPRAMGANDLIRSGATLVQTADDILRDLAAQTAPVGEPAFVDFVAAPADPAADDHTLADAQARLLTAMSPTPCDVDELIRDCQLSAAVAWTVLLDLELAGRVERQPGNRVALI